MLPRKNDEYEVKEFDQKYVMNLRTNNFSYGWWIISGLPWRHIVGCISHKRGNLEDFCDEYYSITIHFKVYNEIMHPIHVSDFKPTKPIEKIVASLLKRLPSRLRKNRRREEGEPPLVSSTKKAITMTCPTYHQIGLNKISCQRTLTRTNLNATSTSALVRTLKFVNKLCVISL